MEINSYSYSCHLNSLLFVTSNLPSHGSLQLPFVSSDMAYIQSRMLASNVIKLVRNMPQGQCCPKNLLDLLMQLYSVYSFMYVFNLCYSISHMYLMYIIPPPFSTYVSSHCGKLPVVYVTRTSNFKGVKWYSNQIFISHNYEHCQSLQLSCKMHSWQDFDIIYNVPLFWKILLLL